MCTHAGLTCGGYEKSVFFDFETTSDSRGGRFRRPLLTEGERESMSEWLTSAISPGRVNQSLLSIDEECEDASADSEIHIHRGPFGAFRACQQRQAPPCKDDTDWPEETTQDDDTISQDGHLNDLTENPLSPNSQMVVQYVLNQPQQPLFEGTWNDIIDSGRIQEVFDDMDVSLPDFSFPVHPLTSQDFSFPYFGPEAMFDNTMAFGNAAIPQVIDSNIPHDAVFLVKHYSTTVLRLLTPFRHSKTPWHILFIPHVKSCLAAITLGETMDGASLCAFYGTLAISAFSLGGMSQSRVWLEQGRAYKQRAREHIREMLKTAYDTPKTAKYKSILMAILTMVQLCMISGNRDQTECYLLEAEKFIRVKGLNRKKSRKVRLLHHCYAFERIFHESTFVGGVNSSHRVHVRQAIESSGASAYSQDNLTLDLSNCSAWDDLPGQMQRVKGREEGENDLHLMRPGVWSATLYPEIFGLPEVYIFLLSLIVRLGREKDDAELQPEATNLSLKEFLRRAKAVERCINQLRPQDQTTDVIDTLVDATHNALVIYFYRRIFNVDASMLQSRVLIVRDCLLNFESAGVDVAYGSARLIWPAFIAACEAEDAEVQLSFANWFTVSGIILLTATFMLITSRILRNKVACVSLRSH